MTSYRDRPGAARIARALSATLLTAVALSACDRREAHAPAPADPSADRTADPALAARVAQYAPVRLTTDLPLTETERKMLPLFIEAAQVMDTIYRREWYGDLDSLRGRLPDSLTRRYVAINVGPWDRLDELKSFVPGVAPAPKGAQFYPADMTTAEFDSVAKAAPDGGKALRSLYTLVRRDPSTRALVAVPYHEAFAGPVRLAATKLRDAAALSTDVSLKRYLELRARALETYDYQPSDLAWLDMKSNTIDLVIGPIETYDDRLFGYKAAHEAYVLVKDRAWSQRLARYAALLPSLQAGLPVAAAYKRERPGTDGDLNAYDVLYYAGQANAGAKTIAINLPNDEEVQLRKGTRRLQLKNAMRAKFDRILAPIADELIAPDQRQYIAFDAFFENTMFHEVAHGLGIKRTIDGRHTVREALKEEAGALEEEKADILGLYMLARLNERGELGTHELRNNLVTFLAGIFRSVRFGAADAHGRANVATLNVFHQMGAFSPDSATGTYRVDFAKMRTAVDSLSARILRLQGDGDYAAAQAFLKQQGTIPADLQHGLARVAAKRIPVDIIFEQGPAASAGEPASTK
jgi:Peptidase family M49